MSRSLVVLLIVPILAVLWVPPVQAAPETCNGRPCIQIGTFNLYWLGTDERFGNPGLRTREEVDDLVELVADRLDIEVVSFQEVNTDVTEERDGKTVKSPQQWQWLLEELRDRGYEVAIGTGGGFLGNQRVVLAWDADEVAMVRKQTVLVRTDFDFGDGCSSSGLRMPVAAELQAGELTFWAVGVHLKSRRDGECADRIRLRQARDLNRAIRRQLKARRGHVFLTGDFNAFPRDSSIKPLRRGKRGFEALTLRRYRNKRESGTVSYLIDPFRSLIDHVMFREVDSKRAVVRKSTVIFDPTAAGPEFADYTTDYSDHVPVMVSLYTDRK